MQRMRGWLAVIILGAAGFLAGCADLTIRELDYTPTDPTTKTEITFTAVVENRGFRRAARSTLAFKVGGETTPQYFPIPDLGPGESFAVSREEVLDVAQAYRNTVTVDVNDEVRESNEANNRATLSYRVMPGSTYLAGAYYYPWYGDDFHGGAYLREHLVPQQAPALGEYDDRQESVIGQHLAWSRFAGLGFWVTSWWGPGSREDATTLSHILEHPDLGDFQIAVFYETVGRTNGFTDYANVGPDVAYLAENYFGHPNYLRIDGRPVLFVYLTRVLADRGTLQTTVDAMRSAAAEAGYEIYIVGDHAFGTAPSTPGDLAVLDAVTNYDVYGSMGATGYAPQASVDAYYADQAAWKALAQGAGVAFIPSTAPGFNDKGVRGGHEPLSRQLSAGGEFGSLFRAMLVGAKAQVDPTIGSLILVTSWNEWHEDTQIEPVAPAPPTSTDDSPSGSAYTRGLEYEGYGERYLEILREEVDP